ncbi:MAG: 50S ribosomal protein L29 [Anaerolineales bacterium]|nr:50S ribosomal protein L29 [Anaerolineales bacterium]NUQ85331.1 50S ribosomal protein L29 [Anaerolineales bacterium]
MKPLKASAIRNMKPGEIETKLADAREELMKLRFQQVTGQLTDSSRLRLLRRDIARMMTVLREQPKTEVVEGEG